MYGCTPSAHMYSFRSLCWLNFNRINESGWILLMGILVYPSSEARQFHGVRAGGRSEPCSVM